MTRFSTVPISVRVTPPSRSLRRTPGTRLSGSSDSHHSPDHSWKSDSSNGSLGTRFSCSKALETLLGQRQAQFGLGQPALPLMDTVLEGHHLRTVPLLQHKVI